MCPSLRSRCRIRRRRTSRASARAAIRSGRRCAGIAVRMRGFTTGTPWLPLGDNAAANIEVQQPDDGSFLKLYRRLIALRKKHPTLVGGALRDLHAEGKVLRFRRSGEQEMEVVLNMTHEATAIQLPASAVLAGTHPEPGGQATERGYDASVRRRFGALAVLSDPLLRGSTVAQRSPADVNFGFRREGFRFPASRRR